MQYTLLLRIRLSHVGKGSECKVNQLNRNSSHNLMECWFTWHCFTPVARTSWRASSSSSAVGIVRWAPDDISCEAGTPTSAGKWKIELCFLAWLSVFGFEIKNETNKSTSYSSLQPIDVGAMKNSCHQIVLNSTNNLLSRFNMTKVILE